MVLIMNEMKITILKILMKKQPLLLTCIKPFSFKLRKQPSNWYSKTFLDNMLTGFVKNLQTSQFKNLNPSAVILGLH